MACAANYYDVLLVFANECLAMEALKVAVEVFDDSSLVAVDQKFSATFWGSVGAGKMYALYDWSALRCGEG